MSEFSSINMYSRPGGTSQFGSVCGGEIAGQSFVAQDSSITEVSVWLTEPNNDSIRIDVVANDWYSGNLIAESILPPGEIGKRTVFFNNPVYVKKGQLYFIKVSAGAPGLSSGAVACQTEHFAEQGYTAYGPTNQAMALEVVFKPWPGDPPTEESPLMVEQEYIACLNEALLEKKDVWGEYLKGLPEGPTYDNMKDLLKPLMHCGTMLTESGVYYLSFGIPTSLGGGGPAALHAADGSQVLSNTHYGNRMTLYVGSEGRERYGTSLHRLDEPRLAKDYLPILLTSYKDTASIHYRQQSFAQYIPETASLVSFIRVEASLGHDNCENEGAAGHVATIRFRFYDDQLHLVDGVLRTYEQVLAVCSGDPVLEGDSLVYRLQLSADQSAAIYIARLNDPAHCSGFVMDAARFEQEKCDVSRYWDELLAQGAVIQVPEQRVMDAQHNLLIQNLYMGWRYSIGNAYETFFQPESSDAAAILGMYGYVERFKAILSDLLKMAKPDNRYTNWEYGEKLSHAAHYYWLTGDISLLQEHETEYIRICNDLLQQMADDEYGLLTPQKFSGDIDEAAYYLHQQAVVWRGLRDIGILLGRRLNRDYGEHYVMTATLFREALLQAAQQAETELADGTLFIPTDIRGAQREPFDPITETRLGSYWNLCMPYSLASGLFDGTGDKLQQVYQYMKEHGSMLLGMVRFNYYPVEVGGYRSNGLAGYKTTGVDNVYAMSYAELFAQLDDPDQLVLALYSKLAHGMTRNTFIAAEGDTIGVYPGEYYRTFYLPPSSANNSVFLKLLRLSLIAESVDEEGMPQRLRLAFATPRDWLAHGKQIRLVAAPTLFGPVDMTIHSSLDEDQIHAMIKVPDRHPMGQLALRLRTPGQRRIDRVTVNGVVHQEVDPGDESIDLSGYRGSLEIHVHYLK